MTEDKYMPGIKAAWHARCKSLAIRPGTQGRQRQLEAFLQGALAALTSTGHMTHERANMIAFLVAVGRGEEFLAEKESKHA